jgi:hypothetical protein
MSKYAIKDSANLIIKDKSTGKIFLYADYANTTSNEWSGDSVYAKAKGVNAIRFDGARQGFLNTSFEVWDIKMLAMLAGQDWVEGSHEYMKREVLTVTTGNKVTLTKTPVAGSLSVFHLHADGYSNGVEMLSGTPDTTEDTYSLAGSEVTLNATSCPVGSQVIVYYLTLTAATKRQLTFRFDKYPGSYEIWADTMMVEQTTGVADFIQVHYPNAKPQANCTISMDASNVSNFEIKFDLFPDANGDMATYTEIDD